MKLRIKSTAYETASREGFIARASYLLPPHDGEAIIEIERSGQIVRRFLYPAYRIYNIAAHLPDIAAELGQSVAAKDDLAGAEILRPLVILDGVQRIDLRPGDVLEVPAGCSLGAGYVARLTEEYSAPGHWNAVVVRGGGHPFKLPIYLAASDRLQVVRRHDALIERIMATTFTEDTPDA